MQKKSFRASTVPQTTLRRLRIMPSYFFLIWRWSMWIYALIVIVWSRPRYASTTISFQNMATLLLVITFAETLLVTLYAPVIQILLPYLRDWSQANQTRHKFHGLYTRKRKAELMLPFAQTRNHYWDIAIYGTDIIICGLVMYYSGPFLDPPFGLGSPFYRYGMSTIFAAAFAYRYRGGLLAAIGYDFFAILGLIVHAPGWHYYGINAVDIAGSLFDAPLVAILSAYVASLLESYAQSKKTIQENARTQNYLVRVGETLLKSTTDRQELLQRSLAPIQNGGHFQRLSIAYISNPSDDDNEDEKPTIAAFIETTQPGKFLPDKSKELVEQVLQSGQKLLTFEALDDDEDNDTNDGLARLYIPLRKNGQIQVILGAESKRNTAFSEKYESFLTIAGAQLLVALDNIRLAEQSAQLVAATERGRIAREMHDGIAQLTYMLSLQAETCQTQAQRIAEASEEDNELIAPLVERLGRLVKISKQALWETRNSMFSLKPSISGHTTLTQMLSNQIREFEAISDLSARLIVEGNEEQINTDQRYTRRHAQIGTAFFGIVQEALTNAYKHADATEIEVHLSYKQDRIEVEVCDNGQGLQANADEPRIYSGHGVGGMKERATELGGSVDILNRETGGTIVHACIPIEKKKENSSGQNTSHDS